jgi:hypothetical protein
MLEKNLCISHISDATVTSHIFFDGATLISYKVKVHPKIGHEGPEGEDRCNATLSSTSALDDGG